MTRKIINLNDAILALNTECKFSNHIGEGVPYSDFTLVEFQEGSPTVSQADAEAKVIAMQTVEDNRISADASSKVSGNTKLLNLGLTQAEATSLTGYTPE